MTHYYPYDVNSTVTVTESFTIKNAQITLRHIPKPSSIVISGFTETSSVNVQAGHFFCNYSDGTQFRDANRIVCFNPADNNKSVTVNYVAIGTVFTADDANEIKAHMENSTLHGATYSLPTASATTKGGVKIGDGLKMTGEILSIALGTTPSTVEGAMWLSV